MFSNRMDPFSYCFRSETTRLNVDIAETLTFSFFFFFIFFFYTSSSFLYIKNSYFLNVLNFELCVMLLLNSPYSFKAFKWPWSHFQVTAKTHICENSKLHKLLGRCSNVQMAISTYNPVSSTSPEVTPTQK